MVTSSFSDSIVFAVHTRKTAFSKSTVFKSFHSRERFRKDPFSLIVFGVVVWTVAVSGTKQYRYGVVWTVSKRHISGETIYSKVHISKIPTSLSNEDGNVNENVTKQ